MLRYSVFVAHRLILSLLRSGRLQNRLAAAMMRRATDVASLGALLFIFVASVPGAALAEQRVALVIGNGAYQGFAPLQNPINDAHDIAASLKDLGFEVMRGLDLNNAGMNDILDRFIEAARRSDVSLFYYAGHAFQISSQNYLVPIDASIKSKKDIRQQTIELTKLMRGLEGSKGLHLVFLDACRNNPLPGKGDLGSDASRDGLARVGDAAGFLVAFATQPDRAAYDGVGRNSWFSRAVLSHIGTQGQDIASMMINVRKDVIAATGGHQVPWENSSLTRQFYFSPGRAVAASPETQLWQLAASSGDPALLQVYVDRYPAGTHVVEAQVLLKNSGNIVVASSDPRSTQIPGSGSEESLWNFVRTMRVRPLVEYYLSRHPGGSHVDEAHKLLSALPRVDDVDAHPELVCETNATHPRDATANTPGVPLELLALKADIAINACRRAMAAHPDVPHYAALLARAFAADKRKDEAIKFYRQAANRGNLRAMVSLGLMLETGDGLPKDPQAAVKLYERAAAGGHPDGQINLAVALIEGVGVKPNVPRAVQLMKKASETGSAIATYNLGVLALNKAYGTLSNALGQFRKAVELGDPRGYLAAATLYDQGRGTRRDPVAAAEMLLAGVESDAGETVNALIKHPKDWSPETIRAVQTRLKEATHYNGPIDGEVARLEEPLARWRTLGALTSIGEGKF